jgi:hypothetical protein
MDFLGSEAPIQDDSRTDRALNNARFKIAFNAGLFSEERLEELRTSKNFTEAEIELIDSFTAHHLGRRVSWEDFYDDSISPISGIFHDWQGSGVNLIVLPPLSDADLYSQQFVSERVQDFLTYAEQFDGHEIFGNDLEKQEAKALIEDEQRKTLLGILTALILDKSSELQLPFSKQELQKIEKEGFTPDQILIANSWIGANFSAQVVEYTPKAVRANDFALNMLSIEEERLLSEVGDRNHDED